MSDRKPLAALPRGIIHVPVTPFTPDNKVDLDTFSRVIEFLLRHNASSLCINLHLAESLNLTIDERKRLAKTAVAVVAGRVPVYAQGFETSVGGFLPDTGVATNAISN